MSQFLSRLGTFVSNFNIFKNISCPRIFARGARVGPGRAGPIINSKSTDLSPTQPVTFQSPAPLIQPGRRNCNITGLLPGLCWILSIFDFVRWEPLGVDGRCTKHSQLSGVLPVFRHTFGLRGLYRAVSILWPFSTTQSKCKQLAILATTHWHALPIALYRRKTMIWKENASLAMQDPRICIKPRTAEIGQRDDTLVEQWVVWRRIQAHLVDPREGWSALQGGHRSHVYVV